MQRSTTVNACIFNTRMIVFYSKIFRKHTARERYEELRTELRVDDWKDLVDHSKKGQDPSSSVAPNEESNQEVSE